LFQLLSKDFLKLKRLVFNFKQSDELKQGEKILEFLQLPIELTLKLSDFMRMADLYRLQRGAEGTGIQTCVNNMVGFLENTDPNHIPVSTLIEVVIPCLEENMLTLNKDYTVVKEVPLAAGKWPESLGNSFFIESEWLLPDFIDMAKEKLQTVLVAHATNPTDYIELYEELTGLLMKKFH
jgi:hypothetical protein